MRDATMLPPNTVPLAPVDRESWHSYIPSFLPDSDAWVQSLVSSERWERRLLHVRRRSGREWVQGHRKWVFQSDDPERVLYRFSGLEFKPEPYSPTMSAFVRSIRRQLTLNRLEWFNFNSVLMYLYDTPDTYCRNHREDEPELGHHPAIGYLGLGDRREFVWSAEMSYEGGLRHDNYKIMWDHGGGDLLVMGGATQERWYHAVNSADPAAMVGPRIGVLLLNVIPGYHDNGGSLEGGQDYCEESYGGLESSSGSCFSRY
ncbi:hypothetical protein BSKO_03952 [Bryopsis sp. KO-2023]|nr:hypothetical protein BSKO_03952 [Bryopsis sp. KO-2023]